MLQLLELSEGFQNRILGSFEWLHIGIISVLSTFFVEAKCKQMTT